MVESLATYNEALETQISLVVQRPLGPFPEKHADVITISSEKQIESTKESNEEEISSEKRV